MKREKRPDKNEKKLSQRKTIELKKRFKAVWVKKNDSSKVRLDSIPKKWKNQIIHTTWQGQRKK